MKKILTFILCLVILVTTTVTVYASAIEPLSNNVGRTNSAFVISTSGMATVSNSYLDSLNHLTSAKIVTKVQKRYGLIWITVDNGSWTDTSTATSFSRSHSVQLTKKGTYRAHVEFTISGTGGSDDKITKNIEKTYS